MPDDTINEDYTFTVKEEKGWDRNIGIFFLLLFLMVMGNVVFKFNKTQLQTYLVLILLTLGPSIRYLSKSTSNDAIIAIDKTGIYYKGKLLTCWANFTDAYITEAEVTGSYSDNFVLVLTYNKDGEEGSFLRKIKLQNTYNKSEEQIIAAIKKFSGA